MQKVVFLKATFAVFWAEKVVGITLAVRAFEDLLWIPPAVITLHKRIATGAASAGPQSYLPPAGLVILVENATKS